MKRITIGAVLLLIFCLGVYFGVYFSGQWNMKRTSTDTPVKENIPEAAHPHTHRDPHQDELLTWTRAPARQLSQEQSDELDEFLQNLYQGVDSGAISQKKMEALLEQEEAILLTAGMTPFEAAQYLVETPYSPTPLDYIKELADQALAENPDDPEVLYFWAGRHPQIQEGPNPEHEAAYEKLLAMEELPQELRVRVLDSFGWTIWYYNPEDAVRYYEEARALSDESFYDLSGLAYQRLGQYDKALEIYRNHYAETGDRFAKAHIEAIEAGEGIPALVRETETSPFVKGEMQP